MSARPNEHGDFWRSEQADAAMQESHLHAWEALAEIEATRLRGAKVLDFGCNSGGLLRLLHDRYGIARGFGLDVAAGAIQSARQANGTRPLEYVVSDEPSSDWPPVDIGFSHEVIYLLGDLERHARDVYGALREGGSYLAVTGVHRESARMSRWHSMNTVDLALPPLRGLEDYVRPFLRTGFIAEVGVLRVRFVPFGDGELEDVADRLNYWTREKIVFRFAKGR
jgi:SAM-dependent methyltransferase